MVLQHHGSHTKCTYIKERKMKEERSHRYFLDKWHKTWMEQLSVFAERSGFHQKPLILFPLHPKKGQVEHSGNAELAFRVRGLSPGPVNG